MHIIKKTLIISMALLTTIILISALTTPNPGHNPNEIKFNLNGKNTTLQKAIENNELFVLPATVSKITKTGNEHGAEEILVSVRTGQKSLLDSLKTSKGLCPTTPKTYTKSIDPGHPASEIKVIIDNTTEMTFQKAINMGMFCAGWKTSGWGSCSKKCGPGYQTRKILGCKRGDGKALNESYCTNPKPSTRQSCNNGACCSGKTDSSGDCCKKGPAYCYWRTASGNNVPGATEPYRWCGHAENSKYYCEGESTRWIRGRTTITCHCK
jgi:hypothetical protein